MYDQRQMEQPPPGHHQEVNQQMPLPPNQLPSMMIMPPGTSQPSPPPPIIDPPRTLPSLLNMQVNIPPEIPSQNPREEEERETEAEIVKLPAALEQALAFKNERAKEVGADPNDISVPGTSPPEETSREDPPLDFVLPSIMASEEDKSDGKTSKGKKKKKKKRKKQGETAKETPKKSDEGDTSVAKEDMPEVEYVQDIPGIGDLEPMYRQFARVFEAFKLVEPDSRGVDGADKGELIGQYPPAAVPAVVPNKIAPMDDFDDDMGQPVNQQAPGENGAPRLSKRKLKRLTRLSVAELKQLVGRPDVVEMHDVTARDPKLLVQLKAHRNTVPVPRHWCFKRKYLQGKRGIEKPPFDLPDFIKRTGITEMRASLQERDDTRTLKAKMRERARPKLGKIDIDYQKLHDAFFKWQTKPRMTIHGDLYYEGKEFETRLKEKKPGELSDELRTALGMPVGPNCHKVPPPWLIAMQRYGPPPSYPNLKIPGLNAPIPESCAFGYHAGGWGKPPVDETGRPLYGDVFGVARPPGGDAMDEEVDRGMWGEPESESSGEEDEDEDGDDGGEGDAEGREDNDASGLVTPGAEGLITPSGITSIPAGLETPETIELRKKKIESEMEGGDTPALYTVLQERRTEGLGASMMGSTHVYDMTGAAGGQAPPSVIAARRGISGAAAEARAEKDGAVELALDPSELDLDSEAMASRYEETMRSRQAHLRREDLSDMLQDHVQRQKSKRKRQQNQDAKSSKKYKEFKF
ncbi:splicing factor 3B subunit 2 [Venturia canescens]|uniref:splicing factor 3B subunit 2 n=1 Tax=Venturia canescens TaxID=32260 RepID=UPI001C9CDA69|nr:splicing factor 3B subunit 2 [Venturia canescens]